jgi:DNA-binding SARP family transcriptional activator/DNA-binding XRE family transcriptional regulator
MDGGPRALPAFGILLRARRQHAQLTQQELAQRAGMSVAAIRDLEQGRRLSPRRRSMARIIEALGLDNHGAVELEQAASETGRPGEPEEERPPAGRALRMEVLGPLAVWRDTRVIDPGPLRQQAVLGLLALQTGNAVHRETIIDALWGSGPPGTAVNLVQTYVSRLRRELNPGRAHGDTKRLLSDGISYRLLVETDELDLLVFRALTERARGLAGRGDWAAACQVYAQSIAMWRGDPLTGVHLLQGHPAVDSVARERLTAVLDYATACEQLGEAHHALPHLWAVTAREPLHEPAHARLMIALAANGEQAAAMRVYEETRRRLDRELGLYPGRELSEAHQRVLNQAVPTTAPAGRAASRTAILKSGQPGLRAERVRPQQLPTAVSHFVGRTSDLATLNEWLQRAGGQRSAMISVIGGMAGVGKTALAVHWAYQAASQFRDGVLYVDLRGFHPSCQPMTHAEAVRGFLDSLGVRPEEIPAGVNAQIGLYRSLLADMQVLVLLDNAGDEEHVRPLLPGGPACMAVVTSRRQLPGLVAQGARPIALSPLSTPEARELLSHQLGEDRAAAEQDAVNTVIGLCGHLPLSLSITAARGAMHPGIPVKALAEELWDVRHRLEALETGDSATGVRAMLSWSYQTLGPVEARMFRLLSAHPGPDVCVPAAASLACVTPSRARSLLRALTMANLLSEVSPGRFAIHDLLRAYAHEQAQAADSEADRRAAIRRMLDHYLWAAVRADLALRSCPRSLALPALPAGLSADDPVDRAAAVRWFAAEQRVLVGAITTAAHMGFDTHTWPLAWLLGCYFGWQGHWNDWVTTQTLGLAAAQGDCHPAVAFHREAMRRSSGPGHHRAVGLLPPPGDAQHAGGKDHAGYEAWQRAMAILRRVHYAGATIVEARLPRLQAAPEET